MLGAPYLHELGSSLGSELASPVGCYDLRNSVERHPIMRESIDDGISGDVLNWNCNRPTSKTINQR